MATRSSLRRQPLLALPALVALLGVSGCAAASFGAVKMEGDGATYLLSLRQLAPNERVFLQFPDERGRPRCCVRRSAASFVATEPDAQASDALGEQPVMRYRLTNGLPSSAAQPFLGIAAIAGSASVAQRADGSLEIAGDRSTGRSCTSEEGFHVIGEDQRGRIASDLYVGLGYAVEAPTCPPPAAASSPASASGRGSAPR